MSCITQNPSGNDQFSQLAQRNLESIQRTFEQQQLVEKSLVRKEVKQPTVKVKQPTTL